MTQPNIEQLLEALRQLDPENSHTLSDEEFYNAALSVAHSTGDQELIEQITVEIGISNDPTVTDFSFLNPPKEIGY